jgi:hypothetical protein
VGGVENDTVIVRFVESTVIAGFPFEPHAKHSFEYILPSVGATKLITFVVVGSAGFSAKTVGGKPLVTWCHWTVASAALAWPPHHAAAQARQTDAVALLLAVIILA